MNTYTLPSGAQVKCHVNVALWAWACYYAHAACNMGLAVTEVVENDTPCLRLESVGAPIGGGLDVILSLDNASCLWDRSEGDPCWPLGLTVVAAHDWRAQARYCADEEIRRWNTPSQRRAPTEQY